LIEVLLAKALICFAGQCHPVLTGYRTPVGVFELVEERTDLPGYGGSILAFAENKTTVFAIHRVYVRDRRLDRMAAIKTGDAKYRSSITFGCVNVEPEVYDALIAQSDRQLEIKR